MPEPIGVEFQIIGAQQVTGALGQMELRARAMSSTMTSSLAPARQAVSALSSALSSTATVLRLTGTEGQALARHLDTATIALSTATIAVQSLRGVALSTAAVITVLKVGLAGLAAVATGIVAVLTAPFTLALAGTFALAVGLAFLDQRFRQVKESALGAALSLREYAAMATGGIDATERLQHRVRDLALTEADWARIRRFAARDSMELPEIQGRLAAETRRAAESQRRLNEAMEEARWQEVVRQTNEATASLRELDAGTRAFGDTLQRTNSLRAAELSMAIALQQQQERYPQVLKDVAAGYEAVRKAIQPVVDTSKALLEELVKVFEYFKDDRPVTNQMSDDFKLLADTAKIVARTFGVDWAEALEITRKAMAMADEEAISLGEALQRIKFNRDFLNELNLVETGMKKWFDAWEKIKFGIEDITIDVAPQIGKALDPALAMFEQLEQRWKEFRIQAVDAFADAIAQGKDFGEVLRSLAQDLIRLAARFIFRAIFGFQEGGITGGPLRFAAAQHGAIVSRPTLAMIGEGGERELVLPERFWPALGRARADEGRRPQEIVIRVINVFDRSQIPPVTAGQITAAVVNDISARGPVEKAIRVALR